MRDTLKAFLQVWLIICTSQQQLVRRMGAPGASRLISCRRRSDVNVLKLLLLVCLAKRLFFFFVRTNTGFDLTQLTRVVAWPSPTLLLLARSGSQRCSFEHLQVVVPHTFVAKVASTPIGPCILYSSPPAREHCTGLPADHAYCTAVCQRVCHVQDSSRVSSISLRIWAEPEAATQREQGHGGDLQRVRIVQDSHLIMLIIQQRSSTCVMYRKPLVCTP